METQPVTNPQDYSAVVAVAQSILSSRFDDRIEVSQVDRLSANDRRNLLLRCTIRGGTDRAPTSVIIKQVVAGNHEDNQGDYIPSDITSWHTLRFFSDWAGAQFVSEAAPDAGHGPRFYGGDLELGFIVMEDLGSEHQSLSLIHI